MSNPVSHTPQTLVFRPTHLGQTLVEQVQILNVPSDAELTATLEASSSSSAPFTILTVASYDVVRIAHGGQIIDMTLDSESDGVTPLAVRKGELVQIFVQLTVLALLSGNAVDRLSVI